MGYLWDFLSNVDTYEWVIKKAFNQVDKDGSGTISAEEIENAISYINSYYDSGFHPTLDEIRIAVIYCDVDKSGTISFTEFMDLLRKLSKYEFPFQQVKPQSQTATDPQSHTEIKKN